MLRRLLALTFVLAACGDDEFTGLPDAPTPDGPLPDTPTTGLVTLTVTVGATGQEGIQVYFQNSDSTVVASATTDANGVASAVMEAGGFVTAIDPFPTRIPQGVAAPRLLKTFSGVKPGDELVLHERDPNPPVVNITLLANLEPSGLAGTYLLFAPCVPFGLDVTNGAGSGSGSIGGAISLQGCGATTDFTIVAIDNSTGEPINAVHKANLALTEGGTVDMTDVVYAAPEGATFEYTDVPGNIAMFNVANVLVSGAGPQVEVFDEALVTSGTGITTARPRPIIPGSLSVVASQFFGAANGIHNIIEWKATTTAYTKSVASTFLTEYTSAPTYDLTQKEITWTVDSAGEQPDLVIAAARFDRETPKALQWEWDIVAPAAAPATSIRFPVLPAPDDDLNPAVGDLAQDVDDVVLAKVPGGYDAVREVVLSAGNNNNGLPLELVTGAQGQIVFQELPLRKTVRKRQTRQQVMAPFAERLKRNRRP